MCSLGIWACAISTSTVALQTAHRKKAIFSAGMTLLHRTTMPRMATCDNDHKRNAKHIYRQALHAYWRWHRLTKWSMSMGSKSLILRCSVRLYVRT